MATDADLLPKPELPAPDRESVGRLSTVEYHSPELIERYPGANWPTESLTIAGVTGRTGTTRCGWYRLIRAKRTPAARLRGGRAVWDSREIEACNRWQMDTLPRRVG
jgi:hypothetical protein